MEFKRWLLMCAVFVVRGRSTFWHQHHRELSEVRKAPPSPNVYGPYLTRSLPATCLRRAKTDDSAIARCLLTIGLIKSNVRDFGSIFGK